MTDDELTTTLRSMYGVDLEQSTAMPYGFVGVNNRNEGQPASLTLAEIQSTLHLMKVIHKPTAFDQGADIHPDTWEWMKRQYFPDVPPHHIGLGTIAGIAIHVRDDVPPGKFWPCDCKRQEDLQ